MCDFGFKFLFVIGVYCGYVCFACGLMVAM